MDFSKIIDSLSVLTQPKLVYGVAITTGLLLFLPTPILQQLGLTSILSTIREYIGITFIGAFVLSAMHTTTQAYKWIQGKRQYQRTVNARHQLLSNLTLDEQKILNWYITHETKTQRLDVDSGIVNGLVAKKFLYRASERATSNPLETSYYGRVYTCDYNIQDWVWKYLNKHKDLFTTINQMQEGNKDLKL
jgi:hypothetical protein